MRHASSQDRRHWVPAFAGTTAEYTIGSPDVGTVGPVWRVHGLPAAGIDSHFFAASPAVRTAMEGRGWIREGYGPDATIMCSPIGLTPY